MAERVGLNPRTSCPVAGFQDQCFQPLNHLSFKKQYKLILLLVKNNNKLIYFANTSLNKLFMITNKMAKFLIKFIFISIFCYLTLFLMQQNITLQLS